MSILNVEIKAVCTEPNKVRVILEGLNADFKGVDHQVDTYFNCNEGRLKLRSGNIENTLIFYKRINQSGPKQSHIELSRLEINTNIKSVLSASHGVMIEVDKKRGIYFIDNVKFHVDEVENLGSFVEIEAIDRNGCIGLEKLTEQCNYYIKKLGINENDLLSKSYSDMLMEK